MVTLELAKELEVLVDWVAPVLLVVRSRVDVVVGVYLGVVLVVVGRRVVLGGGGGVHSGFLVVVGLGGSPPSPSNDQEPWIMPLSSESKNLKRPRDKSRPPYGQPGH